MRTSDAAFGAWPWCASRMRYSVHGDSQMLLLAGLLLILLGLVSGGALLAAAVGWLALPHPTTLWVLFPLASGFALLLAGLGSHIRTMPLLLKLTGAAMLLFALTAVALLVATAGGLIAGSAGFLRPAAPGEPA